MNFEEFTRHLTYEEQQQLLKYLSPADTVKLPDRFVSDISSFLGLFSWLTPYFYDKNIHDPIENVVLSSKNARHSTCCFCHDPVLQVCILDVLKSCQGCLGSLQPFRTMHYSIILGSKLQPIYKLVIPQHKYLCFVCNQLCNLLSYDFEDSLVVMQN